MDASKKKHVSSEETTDTTNSIAALDSVIVDLEAELANEHAHSEKCLEEIRQAFTDETSKMKLEFTKQMTTAIENS